MANEKYYVDSDNAKDDWKEFSSFEEAKEYFDTLGAKSKIIYRGVKTVLEIYRD